MKTYIKKMEDLAAQSAAEEQREIHPQVLTLAIALLKYYPTPQQWKEMFIILSSFFTLAAGDDALAALENLGPVMLERKHEIFRVIEKYF